MDIRDGEQTLMQHLAHGDDRAFWLLWETHHPYIRDLCRRLLGGHPDDAEDAVSETLLKAWEGLPARAGSIESLRAWLCRVAYHVCMDWWRRHARTVPYGAGLEDTPKWQAPRAGESPEEMVLQREGETHLLSSIYRLPSRLREPFILYAVYEMSYADIAARLGISEVNARKRMQQARELLRSMYATREQAPDELAGSGAPAWNLTALRSASPDALLSERSPDTWGDADVQARLRGASTDVVWVPSSSGAMMGHHLKLDGDSPRRDIRIETLRRYVATHPGGWKKRLELANLLYARGAWDEAFEEYHSVLEKQPRLFEVWVRVGKTLRLMGDRTKAQEFFERALTCSHKPAVVCHVRGLRHICDRKYAAAVDSFSEATRLDSANAAHWRALASAYHEAGSPHEAAGAYDEALRLDPDDTLSLVNSHDPLVAAGRMREAQQRLARAVEIDPECVLALRLLATHRCMEGALTGRMGQRTHQLIRRALKLAPDAPDTREVLAHYHVRRGESERGLGILREFVERNPSSPQGWLHYSAWLFRTGNQAAAADAVLKADALFPRDLTICRWACEVLPYAGRTAELRRFATEVVAHYPDRWDALATSAFTHVAWLDDVARACDLSTQLPRMQPQLAAAWLLHAEVLASAGRPEEAMDPLRQALSLLPEGDGHEQWVQTLLWLARCAHAVGEESESKRWFTEMANRCEAWVRSDPSAAYYGLGYACNALGKSREAIQAYESALAHHLPYPERDVAVSMLWRLRLATGTRACGVYEQLPLPLAACAICARGADATAPRSGVAGALPYLNFRSAIHSVCLYGKGAGSPQAPPKVCR